MIFLCTVAKFYIAGYCVCMTNKEMFIVGIDEAGRGPVAGPVAVGGVSIKKSKLVALQAIFEPIKGKDSKKLTEKSRDLWYGVICEQMKMGNLLFAVGMVSAQKIDKEGIVFGIKTSMDSVLKKIATIPNDTRVLLDGSLYAPSEYKNQETIIKGDEKEMIISLASIVAKVERDKIMIQLSKKYPEYGFESHKGYGTKKHYEAIKKFGLIVEHRKSFLTRI